MVNGTLLPGLGEQDVPHGAQLQERRGERGAPPHAVHHAGAHAPDVGGAVEAEAALQFRVQAVEVGAEGATEHEVTASPTARADGRRDGPAGGAGSDGRPGCADAAAGPPRRARRRGSRRRPGCDRPRRPAGRRTPPRTGVRRPPGPRCAGRARAVRRAPARAGAGRTTRRWPSRTRGEGEVGEAADRSPPWGVGVAGQEPHPGRAGHVPAGRPSPRRSASAGRPSRSAARRCGSRPGGTSSPTCTPQPPTDTPGATVVAYRNRAGVLPRDRVDPAEAGIPPTVGPGVLRRSPNMLQRRVDKCLDIDGAHAGPRS